MEGKEETLCSTAKGPEDQERGRATAERCAGMLQASSGLNGFVLLVLCNIPSAYGLEGSVSSWEAPPTGF